MDILPSYRSGNDGARKEAGLKQRGVASGGKIAELEFV
jgi:hypothetical protein